MANNALFGNAKLCDGLCNEPPVKSSCHLSEVTGKNIIIIIINRLNPTEPKCLVL